MNRKGATHCRGSAKILDVDEAGAATKFQSQTFKGARYCVLKKVEVDPLQARRGPMEVAPWDNSALRNEGNEVDAVEGMADTTSSTGDPGDDSHTFPGVIPVPD